MLLSVLFAYFMAKVFDGAGDLFALYVLVIFVAFVVTRLVDLYFHDRWEVVPA